jgi:hypothetical protein
MFAVVSIDFQDVPGWVDVLKVADAVKGILS